MREVWIHLDEDKGHLRDTVNTLINLTLEHVPRKILGIRNSYWMKFPLHPSYYAVGYFLNL
jgi:hypothetical protein